MCNIKPENNFEIFVYNLLIIWKYTIIVYYWNTD